MNTKNAQSLFVGGIPTAPDVERLEQRFGVPKEGEFVPYKALAEVIGMHDPDDKAGIARTRASSRFNTVVHAWRNKLRRQYNVEMKAVPGEGYQVETPSERITDSARRTKLGLRQVNRAANKAARTDRERLSDGERKAADFLSTIGGKLRALHNTEARNYLPSGKGEEKRVQRPQ